MKRLGRGSKSSRRRPVRHLALAATTAVSIALAYDYWASEGQAGAVVALVGASLFLALLVCVPVLLQRSGE